MKMIKAFPACHETFEKRGDFHPPQKGDGLF
jgi:hypothetical protein